MLPYIKIARPDHWFKNVFMLPGVAFAIFEFPNFLSWGLLPEFLLGLLAVCLITSSNYTINEVLDAPMDALHPVKKHRPVPSGQVDVRLAYVQWAALAVVGLWLGWRVNGSFFLSLLALLVMGLIYNVPPLRSKDKPYFDVLSESVNNPLRLLLGWFIVNPVKPPTLSLIMAYWMIGAFFMTVKRYGEYRRIGDPKVAANYRKSFSYYNEYRLILSMVYYASAFSLFFGIFLIRYRIELILSVPVLAGFVPVYMRLAFWEDSPAQYPEKLYRQRGLVVYCSVCIVLVIGLLFIDLPIIGQLFEPMYSPQPY